MHRGATLFLQAAIVALGVGVLIFLLWEPHFEGRNVNSTVFEVYFKDPFLAYAYIASSAFFIALYRAFMLLRNIRNNAIFTAQSVQAVQTIQYCALSLIGFIVLAEAYFFIFQRGKEDIAGGVALGFLLIIASAIASASAAVFKHILQRGIDISTK